MSASVNNNHSPEHSLIPRCSAHNVPVQPGGGGIPFKIRTSCLYCSAMPLAQSSVPSLESSSINIISDSGYSWASHEGNVCGRDVLSLRAGTITDRLGNLETGKYGLPTASHRSDIRQRAGINVNANHINAETEHTESKVNSNIIYLI